MRTVFLFVYRACTICTNISLQCTYLHVSGEKQSFKTLNYFSVIIEKYFGLFEFLVMHS